MGEDCSFTNEEIKKANNSSQNINHFYGSVNQANIQQANEHANQTIITFDYKKISDFLNTLEKDIDKLEIEKDKKRELISDLKSVQEQVKSPRPKVSIIKEGMASIRTILEGAGGEIVASLLKGLIGLPF